MPLTLICPACDQESGSWDEYMTHEKGHPRVVAVGIPRPVIRFVDQVDAQRSTPVMGG